MVNIYQNKHYKLYILIPVTLMIISLYFIGKIQLDSTLKGGVSVQVVTNSTISPQQLTALVDSKIPGAQASVSSSPGGLSITMASNTSISDAETELLSFYSAYGNYTSSTLNITAYQSQLATQPSNTTIQTLLATAKTTQATSIKSMNVTLTGELSDLKPFIGTVQYNATDYDALPNVAKNSYSNASLVYENQIVGKLKTILPFTSYSYDEITPTLGAFFLQQIRFIIIIAFILVAIVVFIIFRTLVPSFSVVFGAANDLIVALGAMGILGIPLGVASVGGLLMLLGFAFDTDILAAIRILKRSDGTPEERAWSSFKTGTTMTITALIAFSVLFIVAYVAFIPTYIEIAGVVLCGLSGDILTTWLTDVPLLLWYKKGKEVRK